MNEVVIVEELGKRFPRANLDRPWTLQEAFVRGFRGLRVRDYFWALERIGFRVAPGKMFGIIGRNGAGKSTLLRLIGGVGRPDQGRITVSGKVSALIDLGAGFHPDLTGRENVFVNGVTSGLTRREVAERFDEIVQFAGIESFIENPYRTYSTGMRLRLAFAIIAHTEPEILLVDEVLAVGDAQFQKKCLDRIDEFKRNGCAILLVSHDVSIVRKMCDEVIWLDSGRQVAQGPTEVVVSQYLLDIENEIKHWAPAGLSMRKPKDNSRLVLNENRLGSLEMEIINVSLLDTAGSPVSNMNTGDPLQIDIEYLAPTPIPSPIFAVTINREDGSLCFETSTAAAGHDLPALLGRGKVSLRLDRVDLNGGHYYVDIGVYRADWHYTYDYHWRVYPLHVYSAPGDRGVLRPPHRWILDGLTPKITG